MSKRRKPNQAVPRANLDVLLELCRHIGTHARQAHTLASLAERANMSQFQIHRLFKAFLHVTPKKYIEQVRLGAFKHGLRAAPSVTEAIFEAGFESSSAVYGRLDAHLGMTPRRYREGGAGVNISFAFGRTRLGPVLIGATDRGVCYLQFGESDRELLERLRAEFPRAAIAPSKANSSLQFSAWMAALNAHIDGGTKPKALPLDIQGTAFQKRVWDFLQRIPRAQVVSYAAVAIGVGAPKSVRAVASACARNRIGVLIPCHRVVRGDGSLGGYRWGPERKRALIDAERAIPSYASAEYPQD